MAFDFVSVSLTLAATPRAAAPCAIFEWNIVTRTITSNPSVAILLRHTGSSAICIPVMTMNGMIADRIPTVSHGTVLYMARNTLVTTAPTRLPIGPTTISAIGKHMSRNSIGLRKDLTRFGETRSAKPSTHFIIGAIRRIGSTDDV